MIVRWSLGDLHDVVGERPFLIASPRWELDLPLAGRSTVVPSVEVDVPVGADMLVAMGGGSAIDTAKHASFETGLPVLSIPTTYSGAEWTPTYGIRTPDRRMVGGGGGANLAAIVYDVALTRDLPRDVTVGTAMNALAHCAEALYVRGRNDAADARALEGAALLARALPETDREGLLRGAAAAGEALALAGLGLAHAMAQALGGRYGLPHGAMNALCLPPVLRDVVVDPRFLDAIAPQTAEGLAGLGGFGTLGSFGVPETDLPAVAAAAAERQGNRNMPRPATAVEIEGLLRSIY